MDPVFSLCGEEAGDGAAAGGVEEGELRAGAGEGILRKGTRTIRGAEKAQTEYTPDWMYAPYWMSRSHVESCVVSLRWRDRELRVF